MEVDRHNPTAEGSYSRKVNGRGDKNAPLKNHLSVLKDRERALQDMRVGHQQFPTEGLGVV
jgi:hypothetical protein